MVDGTIVTATTTVCPKIRQGVFQRAPGLGASGKKPRLLAVVGTRFKLASLRVCSGQLAWNQDQDCEPLKRYGKHGARGTLFKLTLARYRYTFVDKGMVSEDVPYLLHEGKVSAA